MSKISNQIQDSIAATRLLVRNAIYSVDSLLKNTADKTDDVAQSRITQAQWLHILTTAVGALSVSFLFKEYTDNGRKDLDNVCKFAQNFLDYGSKAIGMSTEHQGAQLSSLKEHLDRTYRGLDGIKSALDQAEQTLQNSKNQAAPSA